MNNFGRKCSAVCVALVCWGGLSATAFADEISGTLNLAGTITVGDDNGGTINFIPLTSGSPFTFTVIPSTGSFAGLATDSGTESASLDGVDEPINTVLTTPIVGFLSIPAAPLTFDLTEVMGAATAGSTPCTLTTTTGSCYVAGTPFNFNSGAGGASATFSVIGNFNEQGLTEDGVILEYSATFVGESIADVLNDFLTTGSSQQSSDGELTVSVMGTTTPEPGTLSMFLAGACLAGVGVFKTKRRVSK